MPFDFQKFVSDYRLPTAPSGHKHARRGWINIPCPLHSGSAGGFHMGFNLEKSYFVCYGCGFSSIEKVVESIVGKSRVKETIKGYFVKTKDSPELKSTIRPASIRFPEPIGPLNIHHKQYLESRNFDPEALSHRWKLQGTDHYSILAIGGDRIDYHWRVVAPIEFNGETVSFQGRDITNKQNSRYKACPDIGEVISHKQILYGWDMAIGKSCLMVEGVTGVWRHGPGCLATFGAEYTAGQVDLLAKRFDTIHLFFDPDEAGRIAADNLEWELSVLGIDVIVWDFAENIGLDSGNIAQRNADELMKEVLG